MFHCNTSLALYIAVVNMVSEWTLLYSLHKSNPERFLSCQSHLLQSALAFVFTDKRIVSSSLTWKPILRDTDIMRPNEIANPMWDKSRTAKEY